MNNQRQKEVLVHQLYLAAQELKKTYESLPPTIPWPIGSTQQKKQPAVAHTCGSCIHQKWCIMRGVTSCERWRSYKN